MQRKVLHSSRKFQLFKTIIRSFEISFLRKFHKITAVAFGIKFKKKKDLQFLDMTSPQDTFNDDDLTDSRAA
jgi:hypothetical protein